MISQLPAEFGLFTCINGADINYKEKSPTSIRATRNPQRFVCSSLGCDLLCKPDSCSPARPSLPEYSPCPQTPATFAGKFIGKMLGYQKYIYLTVLVQQE